MKAQEKDFDLSDNKKSTMKLSPVLKYILAILICESAGILSGFIGSAYENTWFDALNKPSWNPPSFVFAPVWTTLYLLMGISLGLIWNYKTEESNKQSSYYLFAFQLFLNFWWSIIFFRFHSPLYALLDLILLDIMIILTIFSFSKFSKPAAWLLVPYISWTSFATILNFTIWNLNH